MDVEILARFQFALTIMFHYIYPPLSIGLGLFLVCAESAYLRTKNPIYLQIGKYWTRIFALTFAIGVATGIVMEFEFGTNWATYSRYVGDVFGSALAAEGVFAFFLESGFLAIMLFGWNRVKPKTHFFSTLMVCLGAHFSAVWIVVANSWMQTPAGYHIVGDGLNARAEIIDFWAMVFNPSSMHRLSHTLVGAWLAGMFLVISVSAYYLLKKKHLDFARCSLKIALSIAFVSLILQFILGDMSARGVAHNQPAKLAAFEGLFETKSEVPLTLFGIVNPKERRVDYQIAIPKLLSYLSFKDSTAIIQGLDKVPEKDWPHVSIVFQVYRLMIAMWGCMFFLSGVAIYLWWKGTLFTNKWVLRSMVVSVLFPQLANEAGWVAAEMGRYPWIVQGLLRISEGLSKSVTANQVLGSIIMFSIVYLFLFILFIYLLNEKIKHGPIEEDLASPYHHLQAYVKELQHD
ncbi:cytochrome ubiquinol oxidase subunit I [Parachlamydia sp. AcF125]|uniref:cytochrome ubiquinol oxidase subunit I n=1 Tax=Parachlamydia sp. AcF125 TaxID=2795736 RepID=UPI001BCA3776|nr:cytochrome ubiquinol oxidase subunit I [Parachlamydia sp. AcF125]MBS4169213.1 Cytochrome bd ubiquinol oxidase subunit 1 [Parachlamydia sp. AcF125]